jgi:hypothetical protein
MTDRFSHPLSIQPSATPSQRSRQSPSRASISSRVSAPQPAGRADRTRTDRSRQPETAFLNPQSEQDAHSYKAQTRSRASTASRSRIPRALQGVGREELDIYLVRWDLLGDDELARACGVSSTPSLSTAVSNSTPGQAGQATSSSTSFNPSQTQPQALSPTTSTAPRLTRSSSSLSSLQTPKPRPRPLKRLSTQILALTLPPSEDHPDSEDVPQNAASSSSLMSGGPYSVRRTEGLFPPSPPGNVPEFEFSSLQDRAQGQGSIKDSNSPSDFNPPHDSISNVIPSKNPELHPLRVLSRLTRELGEACLRLEEENRELRSRLQSSSLEQEEELRLGFERSRDVAGGISTPRKGSTGVGIEPTSALGVRDRGDETNDDLGQRGIEVESNEAGRDRRLFSVFREEDQVSLR